MEQQWIKLADEKPDHNTEVLVWVDGHRNPNWRNNYAVVAYLDNNDDFHEETHDDRDTLYGVIYWMPLPKPPEEESNVRSQI